MPLPFHNVENGDKEVWCLSDFVLVDGILSPAAWGQCWSPDIHCSLKGLWVLWWRLCHLPQFLFSEAWTFNNDYGPTRTSIYSRCLEHESVLLNKWIQFIHQSADERFELQRHLLRRRALEKQKNFTIQSLIQGRRKTNRRWEMLQALHTDTLLFLKSDGLLGWFKCCPVGQHDVSIKDINHLANQESL